MFSPSERAFTRRTFLKTGLTLASGAATIPAFIRSSADALARSATRAAGGGGIPEERILVVLQLAGGNDGLNTVVPFTRREYYDARPTIGLDEKRVLRLGEGVDAALHPGLSGLKALYDDGMLGIIQGVGYPNPNRSHFKSMDIWHTATTTGAGDGWLGRFFDNECGGRPESLGAQPGVAIGRTAPLAMQGRLVKPIAFESPSLFRWNGADEDDRLAEAHRRLCARAPGDSGAPTDGAAAFLLRTSLDAQVSSELIRKAVEAPPLTTYPRSEVASQFAMVSAMIRAGLSTRVYYVSMGGFDTHSGQGGAQGRHAALLEQFGSALRAFYAELKAQGNDGRVLTMVFSEFGRRVSQNASQGTDHGTAAPCFLAGPMVRPGVLGDHPSLTDLDEGDLKHTLDFRSLYSAVLTDWLKADAARVLGAAHRAPVVLRRGV